MWLSGAILVAAALYASVGHGGASAYLAAMALAGTPPEVMKPAALTLNVLVAGIATVRFAQAGAFSWRLLWPFAVTSVPFAFLGGLVTLPGGLYRQVVGGTLVVAAARLGLVQGPMVERGSGAVPLGPALAAGAVIGLLSGAVGVGGGIFLSPLLLLTGWAGTRPTAAVSAAFIVVNSLAGLVGYVAQTGALPVPLPLWGVAAVAGGLLGSHVGSRRLAPLWIRRVLAAVLIVAAAKLTLT